MKLGYVTTYDAHDRRRWSGLGYYLARALIDQSHSVEFVGPLHMSRPWYVLAKKVLYMRVRKRKFLPDRDLHVVKEYAKQASRKLSALDVDVVFSPGTIPIAFLESIHPIVVWTDSTFAGMLDFYPEFTNLCAESVQNGSAIEAAALARTAAAIYSSDWAAQTAQQAYGVARDRLHVVPFGANIDAAPTFERVRQIVAARSSSVCTLLFFGLDWYRKGGDVALSVAYQLNAAGLPTELVVIGAGPRSGEPLPPWVRSYGTIRKSSAAQLEQLTTLIAGAHFMLLPTRADCTPVVFSEANAFGVPCLSTRIGGIASVIRDGVNGATFAPGAVSEYCDYIMAHFADRRAYQELALSSYHEYEARLNWSVAGRAVSEVLANLRG
jgi:glycosyltransferase involved in cell wall biosynthesis